MGVGSTLNFYGNYAIKQTTISDVQYFTIESKPMSGVNVYVKVADIKNEVFVGKTPARATAYFGSTVKIRCSLEGYEDYNGEYRASDLGSGVVVVDPKTTCFITVKKGTSSLPAPQQSLAPQEQPRTTILPQNRIEQTAPAVSSPVQAKPKGFFSRIWYSIRSLFGR